MEARYQLRHSPERVIGPPLVAVIVELGGFEPPTSSMPWKRATNCAIAPYGSRPRGRRPNSTESDGPRANQKRVPCLTRQCTPASPTGRQRLAGGRTPPVRTRTAHCTFHSASVHPGTRSPGTTTPWRQLSRPRNPNHAEGSSPSRWVIPSVSAEPWETTTTVWSPSARGVSSRMRSRVPPRAVTPPVGSPPRRRPGPRPASRRHRPRATGSPSRRVRVPPSVRRSAPAGPHPVRYRCRPGRPAYAPSPGHETAGRKRSAPAPARRVQRRRSAPARGRSRSRECRRAPARAHGRCSRSGRAATG